MDTYKIKYFKNYNRLDPKMLSPLDARIFVNLLRKELKRMNLYYKDYLNTSETIFCVIEKGKHSESFVKKVRFKTIIDLINENGIEKPYKIFVDEEPITEEEASKKWMAHTNFIVIEK